MRQGKLITFEGGDGCGKSTQLALAVNWLRAQGKEVVQTFEPGDTPLGIEIRRLLLSKDMPEPVPACELLLFLADRAQHVEQIMKPALAAGKWVVCDRYSDSTLAYQLAGRKLENNGQLCDMLHWAEQGLMPDLTLWLDLSVEGAAMRMAERQATGEVLNRLDKEKFLFHRSVYHAFQTIQKENPVRIQRVDASQSIEEVHVAVCALLSSLDA